jgi:LacI family transcriptional regulator
MKRQLPKTARAPTIFDLARHAGVSESTVSNGIRDANCVAAPMRARVIEVISVLGYRPNVLARQLGRVVK